MRNLLPIVIIVISIGLFYFHISPEYGKVQALMTQKSEYADALQRAKDLGVLRDQLLTKYNGFSQDDLSRLMRLVPDDVNTVKLVTDINSVAGKYAMTLKGITVFDTLLDTSSTVADTTAPQLAYNTKIITFKFSSTYPNLVKFLQDLEHSLQVVDVKSVQFDVPPDGTDTGVYNYAVTLDTYYLKQ